MSAAADLRALAATRILVKDGPYGTAIQNYGLGEADYRGSLPTNHDQKGNNDLLNLTRPEIAQELHVSVNTVNTHIRNVYAKLGVRDRSAAVQRARELRLLSSRAAPMPAAVSAR